MLIWPPIARMINKVIIWFIPIVLKYDTVFMGEDNNCFIPKSPFCAI